MILMTDRENGCVKQFKVRSIAPKKKAADAGSSEGGGGRIENQNAGNSRDRTFNAGAHVGIPRKSTRGASKSSNVGTHTGDANV